MKELISVLPERNPWYNSSPQHNIPRALEEKVQKYKNLQFTIFLYNPSCATIAQLVERRSCKP